MSASLGWQRLFLLAALPAMSAAIAMTALALNSRHIADAVSAAGVHPPRRAAEAPRRLSPGLSVRTVSRHHANSACSRDMVRRPAQLARRGDSVRAVASRS